MAKGNHSFTEQEIRKRFGGYSVEDKNNDKLIGSVRPRFQKFSSSFFFFLFLFSLFFSFSLIDRLGNYGFTQQLQQDKVHRSSNFPLQCTPFGGILISNNTRV